MSITHDKKSVSVDALVNSRAARESSSSVQTNYGFPPSPKGRSSKFQRSKLLKHPACSESCSGLLEAGGDEAVLQLPRGGCLVQTKIGGIQFGAPPNTIKDLLSMGMSVPTIYVIPHIMFDRQAGLSNTELEFPAYWNFFCLKKKCTFVAHEKQEERIRRVFRETLLGPETINPEDDVAKECPMNMRPNLMEECAAMRDFQSIDELFQFVRFETKSMDINDQENSSSSSTPTTESMPADASVASLEGGVDIVDTGNGYFIVREDGIEVARVPAMLTHPTQTSLSVAGDRNEVDHPHHEKEEEEEEEEEEENDKRETVIDSSESKESQKTSSTYAVDQIKKTKERTRRRRRRRSTMPTKLLVPALVANAYCPPSFGVTVLGSSHGFDPAHSTTGFVLVSFSFSFIFLLFPFLSQY